MKTAAVVLFLLLAGSAHASNLATISPRDLAQAINRDTQASSGPRRPLKARDMRRVRCIGPDEEPTEFHCTWLQRSRKGWTKRQAWLAKSGTGWRDID